MARATVWTVAIRTARPVPVRQVGVCLHDLVEYLVFGSDQSLLDTLYHFLARNLVLKIMFENKFAMTFSIKFKVRGPFDKLLINDSKLARHIVIFVNVQYMGWLPVCLSLIRVAATRSTIGTSVIVIFCDTHKRCWLSWITTSFIVWKRIYRKAVRVIPRSKRFSFVQF